MKNGQHTGSIKNSDWAYMAGIIDGEGCIQTEGFNGQHRGKPVLYVSQKDPRLMDYLYETFGGKVKLYMQSHTGNPIYRWLSCSSEHLTFILENVKEYLVIKKDHAEVALLSLSYGKARKYQDQKEKNIIFGVRKKCHHKLLHLNKRLDAPETSKQDRLLKDSMRCSELGSMEKAESNPEMRLPLN